MRLLLDEDSQGRIVARMLKEAGHDVLTGYDAGLTGQPDPVVLAYAVEHERVLLTRNGKDFLELHQANPNHFGIMVEHQDADPTKNMTYAQIVAAIGNIEASSWQIAGELVSINAWR